jgi:uncharacterized Zn-finger protein
MSAPAAPKHTCEHCYHEFTKRYNLLRHMERIHNINTTVELTKNSHPITKNSHPLTKNSHPLTKNSHPLTKNSHPDILEEQNSNTDEHRCPMCDKVFTRGWYLTKHIETCNGSKNIYECEYCKTEFKHKRSRFKHYTICKIKKELDAKALVPVTTSSDTLIPVSEEDKVKAINNHNVNNHNSTIETQNNIQTQQNIIIVYNGENTQFKTHHIDDAMIQRILQHAHPEVNRKVITEYTREILSLPENQCIKKGDIKSGHTEIHKGDNEWELDLDQNIYPKLASNVANNMSEYLYTKRDQLRKEAFDKLIRFTDYMTDEGYANIDDEEKEKQILKEYKLLVKELKLVVFSKTRKKKEELI